MVIKRQTPSNFSWSSGLAILTFGKYEALPYLFFTGVRNLNCNLSDAPNLAKAM